MRTPLNAFALVLLTLANTALAAPEIAKDAPDFTLTDINGKSHQLSKYAKDKFVVLEWLNYDCPFVKKHYGTKNMQNLQKKWKEKGVTWFSIISSAPGKQGNFPKDKLKEMDKERGGNATAILIDEKGVAAKAYSAKTTPHMFVIAPKSPGGKIVYMGAIDDKPTTDKEDVNPKTKNYVDLALTEAMKPGGVVTSPVIQPYGCSVKY